MADTPAADTYNRAQIILQKNALGNVLHINQIRATPGAHSDPICTSRLMIAEDPPTAQSGGSVCVFGAVQASG